MKDKTAIIYISLFVIILSLGIACFSSVSRASKLKEELKIEKAKNDFIIHYYDGNIPYDSIFYADDSICYYKNGNLQGHTKIER